MESAAPRTWTVIRWALSGPVLTRRLACIVRDELVYGVEELPCAVVDLLDPERDDLAIGFLHAVGASLRRADAVWEELSHGLPESWQWMDHVDWNTVRGVLRLQDARPTEVRHERQKETDMSGDTDLVGGPDMSASHDQNTCTCPVCSVLRALSTPSQPEEGK